jgi:3-isopropylmalate/(R)-2-methylmalate dehydratase small subunit
MACEERVMSSDARIEAVTGRVLILEGDDIDTDRIMPARFLKAITFEGLDSHVFEDDRAAARRAGAVHPFDNVRNRDAQMLLAGANFGCGSSREHAPQALHRWGLRAIIAESFGEIFSGNAAAIGMVCATMSRADRSQWAAAVASRSEQRWTLDIASSVVIPCDGAGAAIPVVIPDTQRAAWLSGAWDPVNLLRADYEAVVRVEARLPYLRATSTKA